MFFNKGDVRLAYSLLEVFGQLLGRYWKFKGKESQFWTWKNPSISQKCLLIAESLSGFQCVKLMQIFEIKYLYWF